MRIAPFAVVRDGYKRDGENITRMGFRVVLVLMMRKRGNNKEGGI